MLQFSFPHLYYDNLTSIDYIRRGEDAETPAINLLRGERYIGYKKGGDTSNYNDIRFAFDSVIEYDHVILSRADLAIDQVNLSYISVLHSGSTKISNSPPYTYADLYNQDLLYLNPSHASNTTSTVSVRTYYSTTVSRDWLYSGIQFSMFFDFGDNPSEFDFKFKSNQKKFITDGHVEYSVQTDLPRRVFTARFEAVTDAKLDTFKTRVSQQLVDNQKAYCYLYDSSGRDELLGASLAHVNIDSFEYEKVKSDYNIVSLSMTEVRG